MMIQLANLFWNPREARLRLLWRLCGAALIGLLLSTPFLCLGVCAMSSSLVQAKVFEMDNLEMEAWLLEFAGSPALLLGESVATLLITVATVLLAGRFLDRRPFAGFGFRLDRGWWVDLGFGLGLGALSMGLIFLAERALGWVQITGTFHTMAPGQSFWVALMVPTITFSCVGIYEELVARGYLLLNLAEGLNLPFLGSRGAVVLAWLFSSVLFGWAHQGNPNATWTSTIYLMLAGIFLGMGYVLTGELAIAIGLHITWNFFQGAVFGFPVSGLGPITSFIAIEQGGPPLWTGGAFGPEAGLLGLMVTLLGGALTLGWVRCRRGKVALHLPLAQAPVREIQITSTGTMESQAPIQIAASGVSRDGRPHRD